MTADDHFVSSPTSLVLLDKRQIALQRELLERRDLLEIVTILLRVLAQRDVGLNLKGALTGLVMRHDTDPTDADLALPFMGINIALVIGLDAGCEYLDEEAF